MPLIIPSNTISAGGFEVANSLRFNDGSSDYLSRTPASSGNRKTFTVSAWVKKTSIGTQYHNIFSSTNSATGTTGYFIARFHNDDKLYVLANATAFWSVKTDMVFRDTSAWYHIVVAIDVTQSTASDRLKIYVNGNLVSYSFASGTYPAQNTDLGWNYTHTHFIGASFAGQYFDGYMAEVVNIDGQQLDPTSFGEFDDSGIWKPIDVSGLTFGTNGFYLPFENSAALGQDDSGNGNNFTVNNLTSIDQTTDTPTNNFCTMNPLYENSGNVTFSNGNLRTSCSLTANDSAAGTLAVTSGKWYWEAKMTSLGSGTQVFGVREYQGSNLKLNEDGTYSSGLTAGATAPSGFSQGDILSVALDLDSATKTIQFYTNGVVNGDPMTLTGWDGEKFLAPFAGNDVYTMDFNFGNPPFTISSGNSDANGYGNFEYSVPSGYFSLCTANLSEYG